MKKIAVLPAALVLAAAAMLFAAERRVLSPDTLESEILRMDPSEVDPSLLPLDSIEELGTTGVPPEIDIDAWRLSVTGSGVRKPLSLSYGELAAMGQVKKKVLLICPGFFADYAEWEGVPLTEILEAAEAGGGYKNVTFQSVDGYKASFTREQVGKNILFLALKVNGVELPKEHGFPLRLVAEDILGGDWIKWLKSIEVN
jgi:DMSO/TMAO reductase YedYZ molybdopterin-dependent catalytic subunit